MQVCDDSYALIRRAVGPRRVFFDHLRTLTLFIHLESWEHLMDWMSPDPIASIRASPSLVNSLRQR